MLVAPDGDWLLPMYYTPNGFADGVDKVEVWLPMSLGPEGELFTRVRLVTPGEE